MCLRDDSTSRPSRCLSRSWDCEATRLAAHRKQQAEIIVVAMTAKRGTKSEADYLNEPFRVMKDGQSAAALVADAADAVVLIGASKGPAQRFFFARLPFLSSL